MVARRVSSHARRRAFRNPITDIACSAACARLPAKKKPRVEERGAKRAPPRRGSVWQVTTQSNGAALMRSCGPSDENVISTDGVLAM